MLRHTSLQDFLDLDVICTETTVELEVICVVQEGCTQGEEKFLKAGRRRSHLCHFAPAGPEVGSLAQVLALLWPTGGWTETTTV